MVIVIVSHIVRPGAEEAARHRLEANAERMMRQPGILFRHTGRGAGEGELVTVTGWASPEYRAAWDRVRAAEPPPGEMGDVYASWSVTDVKIFDARSAPHAGGMT
jgi:heme-degrading monooxygenase HmoA